MAKTGSLGLSGIGSELRMPKSLAFGDRGGRSPSERPLIAKNAMSGAQLDVETGYSRRESWMGGLGLVVFAFPLCVGALEVFDAVGLEVPEACGYFVDEVVVVGD